MSAVPREVRPAALVVGAFIAATSALPQGAGPTQSPAKGDLVPSFETVNIDGEPTNLDLPTGPETVLLFFLSGCSECHDMIAAWNHAYQRRPKKLRVVGIIMDREPPGYWKVMRIDFPVVRAPVQPSLRTIKVRREERASGGPGG